ncbi:hypothetical protein EMIT0P44_210037 [Pseudomonas sp. IT-P44]|uniref:hypothetical protein n=1 Tax=Pseudomonas sp. IT-P44 TaxID=3026451 RepID=UPI0039E0D395
MSEKLDYANSLHQFDRPFSGRTSVRMKNGNSKAGSSYGHVLIPGNGEEVEVVVEFDSRVSSDGFGVNNLIEFKSHSFEGDVLKGAGRIIQAYGDEGVKVASDASGGISIFVSMYRPWATFTDRGLDHGDFLPVLMEESIIHEIAVHPLGHAGDDVVGSYYGVSEWMDVFEDPGAEKNTAPPKEITFVGMRLTELGGAGRSKRNIRLKRAAPLGAIPVAFVCESGEMGLVNIEKIGR